MAVESKESLRSQLRSLISVNAESAFVSELLLSWQYFKSSSGVAFYSAMKDEINLEFLLNTEKELFLPRYNAARKAYEMCALSSEDDLVNGQYGIKEPGKKCRVAEKNEIKLWLIPGMAFSRSGHRLGRGAGFYDRLLEKENGIKCGVCTSEQILEEIPLEAHDIKMDFVLTDKEIIRVN